MWVAAGSASSGIPGSVGRFSFFVIHICPGLLEESIKRSGWFEAHGFPEFCAGEEAPLQQVSLHMVRARDLDGFSVETVDELSQGLILPLDDGLERRFGLRMLPRCSERAYELVFQVSPRGN